MLQSLNFINFNDFLIVYLKKVRLNLTLILKKINKPLVMENKFRLILNYSFNYIYKIYKFFFFILIYKFNHSFILKKLSIINYKKNKMSSKEIFNNKN
jgi:hypothetical protein